MQGALWQAIRTTPVRHTIYYDGLCIGRLFRRSDDRLQSQLAWKNPVQIVDFLLSLVKSKIHEISKITNVEIRATQETYNAVSPVGPVINRIQRDARDISLLQLLHQAHSGHMKRRSVRVTQAIA